MNSIADSDAYFNPERMLAQHQAALTLLQGILADPSAAEIHWLDLASGRGQIIANLDKNLTEQHRNKIHYRGYDIENTHTRSAKKTAEAMGMKSVAFDIGELHRFNETIPDSQSFDFITLTNTVHEIDPERLASILFHCVERLSGKGCLFIYDMDRLPSPELGAVLWSASEIRAILSTLCASLGSENYHPAVGQWQHRICNGWNVQIQRPHLEIEDSLDGIRDTTVEATAQQIVELLDLKLAQTRTALESLTQFGAETGEEAAAKESYLYDFWAITRARENAS